jgi:type VI secretion system secreted protein VgrG
MTNLDARPLKIHTDIGSGSLIPVYFSYVSELNRPFSLIVHVHALQDDLDAKAVLGKGFDLEMPTHGEPRFLHGIVTRMEYRGHRTDAEPGERFRAVWEIEVRPWIWLLGLGRDMRIFQDMSTIDIVSEVFRGRGFSDFRVETTADYPVREYCVQYRESDLDFVHRLLEEDGIRYWIEHEQGCDTVVLCDGRDGHAESAGYEQIGIHSEQGDDQHSLDTFSTWTVEHHLGPTVVTLEEYDFTAPGSDQTGEATIEREHEHTGLECYDYPGRYPEKGEGTTRAQVLAESLQADFEVCQGVGSVRGLTAGARFALTGHQREDLDRDYVVTFYSLHGSSGGEGTDGAMATVEGTVRAVPADADWRPARVTPRPVVHGPDTAEVVGPSGEDIWTDEHGRVKVQFHWDRQGQRDENSTCWVRVSQAWAGDGWGSMHMPHVGHEVIVSFLSGDPDRPIVTGRVYNGNHATFESLPDNREKSGFRDVAKNELVMTSTSGEERIELRDTYGNELILDSKEKTATLRSPTHESVCVLGKSVELTSTSDFRQLFEGNEEKKVDGNSDSKVGGNQSSTVQGKKLSDIWGPTKVKIGADLREFTVGVFAGFKFANETEVVAGAKESVSKARVYQSTHGKTVHLYKAKAEYDYTDQILKVRGKYDETMEEVKSEQKKRNEKIEKLDAKIDEFKQTCKKKKESAEKAVSDFGRYLAKRKEKIEKVSGDWKLKASKAVHDAETVIANVMKIMK